MNVKFGVFADLHIDIMHDGEERLGIFLDACRKENVDFIAQLGDFSYPDEGRKCICRPENTPINVQSALKRITPADKAKIVGMFENFEKPSYHVIGNHECDLCSKKQILEFWGRDKAYYSFDTGGVHFVVLDPNYGKPSGQYTSYENGNYFDFPKDIPYLPEEQLEWLREDLNRTEYPTVLFSHQRLCRGHASIRNADALREIMKEAPHKVILSVNGHEHVDELEKEDNVYFLNLNSISSFWVHDDHNEPGLYGEEIDKDFPDICHVIPYRDPVFAIITIDEKGIKVDGRMSAYVGRTPEELDLYEKFPELTKRGIVVSPHVRNRFLPL